MPLIPVGVFVSPEDSSCLALEMGGVEFYDSFIYLAHSQLFPQPKGWESPTKEVWLATKAA